MSDEEIDVLVVRLERSLRAEIFVNPKIVWVISALLVGPVFVPEFEIAAFFAAFSAATALFAWCSSRNSRDEWRQFQRERAFRLWRGWMQRETYREMSYLPSKTAAMREVIGKIYLDDKGGETLPLKQAFRLVDTFSNQQQRLNAVSSQLAILRDARDQLLEKSSQLEQLGETNSQAQLSLSRLETDFAALEALHSQIEDSCRRLEALLFDIKKEREIKRLHGEIKSLTASLEPREISLAAATDKDESLLEIEHQISFEIETFLRLERETDRHLREL